MIQILMMLLAPTAHDEGAVGGPENKPCVRSKVQTTRLIDRLSSARQGLIVAANALGFMAFMAGGFLLLRLLELALS